MTTMTIRVNKERRKVTKSSQPRLDQSVGRAKRVLGDNEAGSDEASLYGREDVRGYFPPDYGDLDYFNIHTE